MTPIIQRLQDTLPELPFAEVAENPLNCNFKEKVSQLDLDPDFYRKVIPRHLELSLEYSLLRQQLRKKFLSNQLINEETQEQLIDALRMAELLEHVYQEYLNVPREVARLRKQQKCYRELLDESIRPLSGEPQKLEVNSSWSQDIRNTTVFLNLYRLLLIRSKRAFDVIATLGCVSDSYRNFVRILDKCTDPVLACMAWIFFMPRLLVNLFLLLKHTLPGFWMGNKEQSLGWRVRFNAQMQRRWFELCNDSMWLTSGLINRFVLTGALAPFVAYLSIVCFAIDVILSVTRAYIELTPLYELEKYYKDMLRETTDLGKRKKINEHLETINNQLNFQWFRLGSHMMTTSTIFLAMAVAVPVLAFHPLIISIGAISLVAVCFINFALFQMIEKKRPKDALEIPRGVLLKNSFFAKTEQPDQVLLYKSEDYLTPKGSPS